jgi:hypothetical protein
MWSPDGSTVFTFTGPGNSVLATRLRAGPVPTVLSLDTLGVVGPGFEPYPGSLHPDGDRFIFAIPGETTDADGVAQPERIIIVENFVEELRRLVGR